MSTFEALKLAYVRSSGKDEPGMLALLAFGSISGSVGATMVYPLNLVRTRLQASGSSGHPERYSGIADVVRKTYGRDGWRGFYRGLVPTLAKVSLLRPLNLSPCHPSPPPPNVGHSFSFDFLRGVRA
jgi:solute carrier family 25 (mitochondrial phosphate transporter), member 23/24/25/41